MNAVELLVTIIREHAPEDIWRESPLVGYRMLANTNRGAIGEEFIRRYLRQNEIEVGNGGRVSPTDLRIEDVRFEVKTARKIPTPPTFLSSWNKNPRDLLPLC